MSVSGLAGSQDATLTDKEIDQVFTNVVSKSHNVVLADGVKKPSATATGRR